MSRGRRAQARHTPLSSSLAASMAYLAAYFKRQELCDIQMVIRLSEPEQEDPFEVYDNAASPPFKRARRDSDDVADDDPLQLSSFPAHRLVVFSSEYFKAQSRHWQAQPNAATRKGKGNNPQGSSSDATEHPSVHLTIDSAEQLPAAEAVIAAMYGVPDAVSKLEHHQLVHAVIIADMVGAEAAAKQAVYAMNNAAHSQQGLSAAALDVLTALPAWPACLLWLLPTILGRAPCCRVESASLESIAAADVNGSMQRLLLAVFADLEAVWADKQLQKLLLSLPVPAVQLLLSSDQLRVASEDTVLYTAQRYVSACGREDMHNARRPGHVPIFKWVTAAAALALLVRAPQLSLFALSCAALATGPPSSSLGLLQAFLPQLRSLLSLKHAASAEQLAEATDSLSNTPPSWKLGARQLRPLTDGVRLQWRLPVEQLRQACRNSFAKQTTVELVSAESTPPMGGLAWQLAVQCLQQNGGTVVGVYAGPTQLSADMWYKCKFTITWDGVTCSSRGTPTTVSRGFSNFFGLGPMAAGGWDEAAWAAAELPTSGETLLQLHVHSVG